MNSTPEQPEGMPQEPDGTPPIPPAEPLVPPEPVAPPEHPVSPPPPPPRGPVEPGPLPPEYPPGPIPPPYAQDGPPAWTAQPPQPRRGLSFGAWLGIGLAIGVGAHIVALTIMFASASAFGALGIMSLLWPFILVAVVAGVLMFFVKTRAAATGVLIICAAMWLLVIGPCIALLGGLAGIGG